MSTHRFGNEKRKEKGKTKGRVVLAVLREREEKGSGVLVLAALSGRTVFACKHELIKIVMQKRAPLFCEHPVYHQLLRPG